jgi:hypothetical protein
MEELEIRNEKHNIYHTVRTFPKFNRKIVERGEIDTTNTQIHDHSLSCLGTCTSIKKNGGVRLFLWAQTFLLSEIMLLC